jgi:pyridoxal phosphate enzyme (YggS family)
VTLVAVTKSADAETTAALAGLGAADLGENRADALASKRSFLASRSLRPVWHLIGHLQTNKLRKALPHVDVLHSLDRPSLIDALATELQRSSRARLEVFMEVNVSGEESKGGFRMEDVFGALDAARGNPRLAVRGFMTMAPLSDDPESSRPVFRRLRELRDEAHALGYLDGLELSMGMSQDFEIAVEEGATHVRVGTCLFAD